MSQKNEEPQTLNLKELQESLQSIKKDMKELKDRATPAQVPSALTENTTPTEDYRVRLCEMLKDIGQGGEIHWKPKSFAKEAVDSEKKYFESIGAVSAGSAIPDIWAAQVHQLDPYPASAFLNAPFINWHSDIKGAPGDSINVITVAKAVGGTAGCAEPVSTAPAVSAKAITLSEYQCSMYVCRADLEDIVPDTIDQLNESLSRCIDNIVDQHFIATLRDVAQGTYTMGGAPGTAHLTPSAIAASIGSMRAGTIEPVTLLIHPAVEAILMQDSQFVNAATFGDRSVVTGGHIIKYLGLDIVVVPAGSLVVDAPGTYDSFLFAKNAIHAAMKRPPSIEAQYLVQTQRKYVYESVRFGCAVVDKPGLWCIRSGVG